MVPPERDTGPGPVEEPRPWEEPGAVRRDVAPHMGELLRWLATISLACSASGVLLVIPAVVGVLLGSGTASLAERDPDWMGCGKLDPGGRAQTHQANLRAENARYLGILAPLPCLLLWESCLSLVARFF